MTRTTASQISVLALAVALFPIASRAQVSPAPAAATNATDEVAGPLKDIVVTAQRREQSLQKTPLAVSAFSAEDLDRAHVSSTLDLVHIVPNLVGTHNTGIGSANTYYLRGQGNTESISTFDPAVATYIDDVIVARQGVNNFSFFDVERIEVLRGPQGTLFGRNTTGGAINLILRKPSPTLGGSAEVEYGSYNRFGARGTIDLPVSEQILTKFSFFGYKNDGYARNITVNRNINGDLDRGVRGAVRLLPADNVTWDISSDYINGNQPFNLTAPDANGNRIARSGLLINTLTRYLTGRKATLNPFDALETSWSINSNLAVRLGGVTLNSITGYRISTQAFLADGLGELLPTSIGYFPNATTAKYKQVSQELKASGLLLDDRLTYVLGYYFIHEDNAQDLGSTLGAANGTAFVLGDRTVANTTTAHAFYGQFDYRLTDRLTATAGIRWTDETKHLDAFRNPGALGPAISDAGISAAGIPLSLNAKVVTPRFALNYQAMPTVMVFASATRGFKSGGWNARATNNSLFTTFEPEKVWSEELGLRSELFDRSLRFNVTLFHYLSQKTQQPAAVFSNGQTAFTTTNPADLSNYGAELEIAWVPVQNLTISGSAGVQNAKFVNISSGVLTQQANCQARPGTANTACNAGFVDVFGNIATPLRAPDVTTSLQASYRVATNAVTITPNIGFSLTSPMSIGTAGSKAAGASTIQAANVNWVGTQWLLNAGATFKPTAMPNLTLTVECKNCLMKDYAASALGPLQYFDPRGTWDLRLGVKF